MTIQENLRAGELSALGTASNPFRAESLGAVEPRTGGPLPHTRAIHDTGTGTVSAIQRPEPARNSFPDPTQEGIEIESSFTRQTEGDDEQQETEGPSRMGQEGEPVAYSAGRVCLHLEQGGNPQEQAPELPAESSSPLIFDPSPSVSRNSFGWGNEGNAATDLDFSAAPEPQLTTDELGAASQRLTVLERVQEIMRTGCSAAAACAKAGVPQATFIRYRRLFESGGLVALAPRHRFSGRRPIVTLTEDEKREIRSIYLRTNRADEAGSKRTAAKMFALAPECREELRAIILPAVESGRVPDCVRKALASVTRVHFAARRSPGMLTSRHFSGNRGAYAQDKIDRLRVIESDDGTLNVVACVPWQLGGDPCSDKYGVRVGRWQFLPAIDAGWSHFVLGYTMVARPRGSYRTEDVRALIQMVATQYGLPDAFRFERGIWETDSVRGLLEGLGVELKTVYKPTSKPFIEGFFSKAWTYLSVTDGQVGRYRGEEEEGNRLQTAARAGRINPTEHFPMLADVIRAVDGAVALHNSDTVHSTYGTWIPSERHKQLAEARPWRPLPQELGYLFSPFVRDWTVTRGSVGGMVPILDDYSAPFHFANADLWRLNGSKVRVYFDPTSSPCVATLVAVTGGAGYRPGEVIGAAELLGELPHFCRAATGWAQDTGERSAEWRKAALAAVRRDVRSMTTDGRVGSATIEQRDGRGTLIRASAGTRPEATPRTKPAARTTAKKSSPPRPLAAMPDDWRELLEPAPPPPRRSSSYSVGMDELGEL